MMQNNPQSHDMRRAPAFRVLTPSEVTTSLEAVDPALAATAQRCPTCAFEFIDSSTGSRLIVASRGGSSNSEVKYFALGGFRIVPEALVAAPGFNHLATAVGLAIEMEDKISVARTLRLGTSAVQALWRGDSVRGAKCVLVPGNNCWPGQPNDREALLFAASCLKTLQDQTPCTPATGQDVGHGPLSKRQGAHAETVTSFLHHHYSGSVDVDTSIPTAHGLFHLIRGHLHQQGLPLTDSCLSLFGLGKIGREVLRLSLTQRVAAIRGFDTSVESLRAAKGLIAEHGREDLLFGPNPAPVYLNLAANVIAFNGIKHDLTAEVAKTIATHMKPSLVCGCENNLIPTAESAAVEELFRSNNVLFVPTTVGGPWGAVAALCASIDALEGRAFNLPAVLEATNQMFDIGRALSVEFFEAKQSRTPREVLGL